MTYLELADKSARDLDRGKITLGEYEERIKPLRVEIKPWNGWTVTRRDKTVEWLDFDQ